MMSMEEELDALLEYNLPLLETDPELSTSTMVSPLTFYDTHVDIALGLKRVRLLPSLLIDMLSPVDSARRTIQDMGIPLPCRLGMFTCARNRRTSVETIVNADDVAEVYERTTASYCLCAASTISFTPRASIWEAGILSWRRARPGKEAWTYHTVKASLQINSQAFSFPDYKPEIEEALKQTLLEVAKRFPEVAIWCMNMISDESQTLFEQMDRVASSRSFRSHMPLTKGHLPPSSVQRFLPDARNMLWTLPANDKASGGPRRSTRTNMTLSTYLSAAPKGSGRKGSTGLENPHKPWITLPPQSRANERRRAEHASIKSPEHLVQHAWVEAVRQDATIIVFNCGNFERIGIRHRRTQTLYLSQLISPQSQSSYGKLQIGLYIAAIQDAIDRTNQHLEAEALKNTPFVCKTATPHDLLESTRRFLDNDKGPTTRSRKRRKIQTNLSASISNILREAQDRPVALVHLNYDIYNSPVPSAFLRHGSSLKERVLNPHRYMSITITSKLGQGATGILHGAKLELEALDGQPLTCEVVVKLAFSEEQRTRMEREYSIYCHLAAAKVAGVMSVFGLFRDIEGDTMALVMTYGGISLGERELRTVPQVSRKPRRVTTVSSSERSAFIHILQSIHDAGVRHRDIRPQNLLVNDDGTVSIIDFDSSTLNFSEVANQREMSNLISILDGEQYRDSVSRSPPPLVDEGSESD